MIQIQQLLDDKTVIHYLDLSFKKVDIQGVQALAKSLKINTVLSTLNLMGNKINDKCAQILSEVLKLIPL